MRSSFARPANTEILAYRAHVEARIALLLDLAKDLHPEARDEAIGRIEMGMHHEQQHQELIATDIKHALWTNPLRTPYAAPLLESAVPSASQSIRWAGHPGGLVDIGRCGEDFAFDNEAPRHTVFLQPFQIASRAITCGEYLAFMEDGGYRRPELWLSDGWDTMRSEGWEAPLYWDRRRNSPAAISNGKFRVEISSERARDQGDWQVYTLRGTLSVAELENTPVCHVSYFEADAFARWYGLRHPGARLPTESEWEAAADSVPVEGNFLETSALHPRAPSPQADNAHSAQMFGDVWEWTQSAYLAYPGYEAPTGALGEYNGKFMSGSMVLRGGSCATSATHIRSSYRNFFHPATRWQFSGIRLARLISAPATRL